MSAFLASVCAGLVAQGLRVVLQKLGLFEEFSELVLAMFVIVSAGLLVITGYLGLKAALLVYWGIEIHWFMWLWPGTVLD